MLMCMANIWGVYCRFCWSLNKLAAPRLLMLETMSDSLTDVTLRLPLLGTLTDCSEQRLTTCTYTVTKFLPNSKAPTQPPRYKISPAVMHVSVNNTYDTVQAAVASHTSGKRSQCNLEMRAIEFWKKWARRHQCQYASMFRTTSQRHLHPGVTQSKFLDFYSPIHV